MDTKRRILIVDQAQDVLDALSMVLEKRLYHVSAIDSEKQLLVAVFIFKPQLIILDINIGGNLHGKQICNNIKSDITTMNIPILLMSAFHEHMTSYRESLADDIIEKPFDLNNMINKINYLLLPKIVV